LIFKRKGIIILFNMKKIIISLLRKFPYFKRIYSERDQLKRDKKALQFKINQLENEIKKTNIFAPPGHFYSPLPSIKEIKKREKKIFNNIPHKVPGIDLNEKAQISLLNRIKKYYIELPFKEQKQKNLRYFFKNASYSYGDAIILYCMIRYLKPKRIIEVGSGYSSCAILDTNDLFFNGKILCTFIDPYPKFFKSLIKGFNQTQIKIIPEKLSDIKINRFFKLSENDILFIDSTHVSKIDSDVNHIFFNLLPSLRKGVYIHFHDIFYPFEYQKEWIYEGRAWNEAYLLKAFLQYNKRFQIQFFNSFLGLFFKNELKNTMPLFLKNPGGSIWLKKT